MYRFSRALGWLLELALMAAMGCAASPVLAHGERAQEPYLRTRTAHWYDVKWSIDKLAVNDTITVTSKFRLFGDWPQAVNLPETVFVSNATPGPVFARVESFLNGVPARQSFRHLEVGRDYEYKMVLKGRIPGRFHVHPMIAVKGSGSDATFARPMFQGKLTADVKLQGPAPHIATIQIGAFRADQAAKGSAPAPITAAAVTIDESKLRQRAEAPFQEAKQAVDLSQAERIVSVGRGIKSLENIAVAEQLAKAFGAELAASRPICDNGWLPMERQIGSSGQTVAPKLYVALGISGAIQHLVGMKGSRTIVAINKDAEAPIFEVADYGIQGDLFELAPAIIAELQK